MLPSPSNMKSKDIPRILDGEMPDPSMLPAVGVGEVTMSQWLKHDMKRYVKVLNYISEMEALFLRQLRGCLIYKSNCSLHYQIIQSIQISSFISNVQGHLSS